MKKIPHFMLLFMAITTFVLAIMLLTLIMIPNLEIMDGEAGFVGGLTTGVTLSYSVYAFLLWLEERKNK